MVSHAVTRETLEALSEQTFNFVGVKQGMPHDSVFAVTQDSRGYIWIGTFGGLARFDGRQFHVYRHVEGDPRTLPDNTVRAVRQRSEGGLWVGTGAAGLAIYDPATDTFRVPQKEPALLRRAHIFAIEDDRQGGVWIAHSGGLSHYNAQTHTYENFGAEFRPADPRRVEVFSVHVLDSGDVLAGGHGLFLRRKGHAAWEPLSFGSGLGDIGGTQAVWSIFQSHDGEVWIGTDVNGLGRLDWKTKTVHGVPHLSGPKNLFGQNTVRSFAEPSPGQFWIGSYGGGLLQMDERSGATRVWKRDPTALSPLCNNFIRSIFLDPHGTLWVATNAGLSYTDLQLHQIHTIFSSPLRANGLFGAEVRSVAAVGGRVLVGFDDGGLAAIEPDGAVDRVQPAKGTRKDQVSGREVMTLRKVDETTAVAGGGGLFRIDLATLTYRKIDLPELRDEVLKKIAVSGRDLWLATYAGLLRYNLDTGQVQRFQHRPDQAQSLVDNYVLDLLVRPDGKVWVGTRLGLELLDPKTGRIQHFLHVGGDATSLVNSNAQSLALDAKGRLWVGSVSGGVSILTSEGESRPVFRSLKLGTGSVSPVILALAPGRDGRMWINTPVGLMNTDADGGDLRIYGAADGLQDNAQNLYGSTRLEDGTLLFPGHANLTVTGAFPTQPHQLHGPLLFTELNLPHDARSPLAIASEVMRSGLTIRSHEGFDASFADLDYGNDGSVGYSYRLRGFDRDWRPLPGGQRTVAYTNLSPGSYELELRADRETNLQPLTTKLRVTVEPRLFERLWFRALVGLLLLICILLAIRWRTAALTRNQKRLEAKIEQRTADLREREEQLKEANVRLAELATQDFLTGVPNRRGFLERAELEIARCRRERSTFCVCIIDLDHFKQLNDVHGHDAGDQALRLVSNVLRECVRITDCLGRWGGEEFILLLPLTDLAVASVLLERLRLRIAACRLDVHGESVHMTASFGIAVSGANYAFEEALALADKRLYLAKQLGRNRIQASDV